MFPAVSRLRVRQDYADLRRQGAAAAEVDVAASARLPELLRRVQLQLDARRPRQRHTRLHGVHARSHRTQPDDWPSQSRLINIRFRSRMEALERDAGFQR